MKCIKCNRNNVYKAKYCQSCHYEFSDKEREIAKGKTIPGKIKRLKELYELVTLKKFTDGYIRKIIGLIIALAPGVLLFINNGNALKIEESPNYQIQKNEKEDEYYLLVNDDEATLDLYIPNSIDSLSVEYYNAGSAQSATNYSKDDTITLVSNDEEDFYILNALADGKVIDKKKVCIYRTEV